MDENKWLECFGKNLTRMVSEAGYTRRELADATGLAESTIGRYMKGDYIPKATALINIASILLCDINDLINFGEDIDF